MNALTIYLISIPITAVLLVVLYKIDVRRTLTVRDIMHALLIGAVPCINVIVTAAVAIMVLEPLTVVRHILDKEVF